MRARFYEPSTGRFVSEDPAMDGANWFEYSNNVPTAVADYTGKWYATDLTWYAVRVFCGMVGTLGAVTASLVPIGNGFNEFANATVKLTFVSTFLALSVAGFAAAFGMGTDMPGPLKIANTIAALSRAIWGAITVVAMGLSQNAEKTKYACLQIITFALVAYDCVLLGELVCIENTQ